MRITALMLLVSLMLTACGGGTDSAAGNKVQADITAPALTLKGDNPQQLFIGDTYIEAGANAIDDVDGDITNKIVIEAESIDNQKTGQYSVNYRVADESGNQASLSRIVEVKATVVSDTNAPVLTLNGDNTQQLFVGAEYSEAGASAIDDFDGDISEQIIINAEAVDNQVIGQYSVSYSVTDQAGNLASLMRIIEVIAVPVIDATPPVLTLLGDNPQKLFVGAEYSEAGASAIDDIDDDISEQIIINAEALDNQVSGQYSVSYSVTDEAGNQVSISRVVDVQAPVLSQATGLSEVDFVSAAAADFSAIAVNSEDSVYLIYADLNDNGVARVKMLKDSLWQNVGSNNGILSTSTATFSQLAIDSGDNVFVAYIENDQVKIQKYDEGSWQMFSLPKINGGVDSLSFKLDHLGTPYLLYGQAGVFTLLSYQQDAWQQIGGNSFNVGRLGGNPYVIDFTPYDHSAILISYRNTDNNGNAASTLFFDGSNWQPTTGLPSASSIALTADKDGNMYAFKVGFFNKFGAAAVYQLSGTQWTILSADGFNHELTQYTENEISAPVFIDIKVNTGGDIYVAYTDPQTINAIFEQGTVIAKYNGSEWRQLNNSNIAPTSAKTRHNSLAIANTGLVHAAFIDGGTGHSEQAVLFSEVVLLDTDGDGIADIDDADDDNDGYPDDQDYAPLDPNIWLSPVAKPVDWLTQALTNAGSGTTIEVPAGVYHGVVSLGNNQPTGTEQSNITIVGEKDAKGKSLVTFDGTVNIDDLASEPWQLVNGIWQRKLQPDTEIWQLLVKQADTFSGSDYSQMVPARWPNAKFTDGSIYLRSAWAKATETGHNPVMRHKNLKQLSYPDSMDALNAACFSRFADAEDGWLLNDIGATQKQWLLAQTYIVDSLTLDKCVGTSTDANVSYDIADSNSIQHSLAAQSFDATGAMAILNYGHWRTWTRPVLVHTPSSNKFSHVFSPEYHGKNHYYYLEGALSLLDSDEEWYFDKHSDTVYFLPSNNANPNNLLIRAKVQSYAFEFTKAKHVSIKDVDFFATTIKCKSCSHMTIDNANFAYGGASKRMLKHWATAIYRSDKVKLINAEPDNVYISGSNNYETGDPESYVTVNNVFKNSTVTNTDSPALHLNGKDSVISNNHFENVDYTCTEGWPYQAAVNTYMGFDTDFSYNTLINTACSQALRGREGSDISHNYIKNSGWAQTDGALLGGGHSMAAAFNWTIDHKEKGIRYDAAWPPTAIEQWGTDSYAHHNVTMRTKGMVFKGWKQRIYNNTIVDQDYIAPISETSAALVIPRLVIHNDTKMTKNSNASGSDIYQCVGEPIEQGGCGAGVGSIYANNLSALILGNIGSKVQRGDGLTTVGGPILASGYTNVETNSDATSNVVSTAKQNLVQKLLRDPQNYDFRPKLMAAQLIAQGSDITNEAIFSKTANYANYIGLPDNVDYIGAYSASDNYYSIPGKRESQASHPIPLNNLLPANQDIKAKVDTDLIWRPALIMPGQGVEYKVFLDDEFMATYDQGQNIHRLTEMNLVSGQSYQWRVDVYIDGVLTSGELWQFTVE
ncbi:DUF5011 domain-containing protein [Thalassotalea fonticola]|uniref:DUF5011 domain-containing protein n=1 Tax=Thalassotalea fonticola TaxID=3065649 RepID=A0ABZ0GQR7_9GAMM|nr:DUF5011 domain-containing protein [Colwelliaceae bacterium S1-1]